MIPFQTPEEAKNYLAEQIDKLVTAYGKGNKTALPRLRAISSALDAWGRLHRLEADTAALADLANDLEALRQQLNEMEKAGPIGITNG